MADKESRPKGIQECKFNMFLHDDALTERICSDLEQLKYAQILTSLAMTPLFNDHRDGVISAQQENTTRSLSNSDETRNGERNELSRREKRRVKPTKKVQEWQTQENFPRTLGTKRNNRGTKGSRGTRGSNVINDVPNRDNKKTFQWKMMAESEGQKVQEWQNQGNCGRRLGTRRNHRDTKGLRGTHGSHVINEDVLNRDPKATFQWDMDQKSEGQQETAESDMVGKETCGEQTMVNLMLEDKCASKKNSRYRCHQCGKCFKTYYTYSIHIRMPDHTEETPFVCDICGKGFRLSSTLCRHKIIHTSNKPHQCKICSKTFNRSSTLKMHMRTHSGRKQHVCVECGKGFHQKGNLRNHMFVHSGERPFHCDMCGRLFNKKSNLKHHLKIHEINGKLACTVCKTMFPRHEELRKHMEMVHCK